MREALVFGASGQIGERVVARLLENDWRVVAVSRQLHADSDRLRWLRGDLAHVDGLPRSVDAIFSCGPLDHFTAWYAMTFVASPRVVAFGSTSVSVKAGSADAAERDLAQRLHAGEHRVLEVARIRNAQATVLRPTLVYGVGRDRTLTRIAGIAKRLGWFVLPRGATGLRQPVHVDDLAQAALDVVDAPATFGQVYPLPGGETLPYREMVHRVLRSLHPPTRLLELPVPAFRLLLRCAQLAGRAGDVNRAMEQRLRDDLVFDAEAARRDFGYSPRAFEPTADMFAAG